MVDSTRLTRLIARVSDAVSELQAAKASEERTHQWLLSVKYLFVVAIEGCTDVSQHLCASEGWGPPSSNADALRLLARHGILEEGLSEEMARAIGFRNILVHQYAEVDDDRVVLMLDRLADLREFTSQVADWVEDHGADEPA